MKRQSTILLAIAALASGLISAYCWSPATLEANIPFDFTVWDTKLPAGKYLLRDLLQNGQSLLIQTEDAEKGVIVIKKVRLTEPGAGEPRLEFKRYGESYFLTRVWQGGSGAELPKSHLERELARTAAKPQPMLVAARLR